MIRTFALLTMRSFKNRVLHALRRMRQPRYLVSFIVAIAYFWFMVVRRMVVSGKRMPIHLVTSDFVTDAAGIVMLVILLIAWAFPDESGGIEFSESEIAFLFPAPLTRAQILLYKVFRGQPRIVISASIMTILGLRAGKFLGVWLLLTALSIYFMTVGLARARLKLAGVGFLIRLPVVLALGALVVWALRADLFDGPTPAIRSVLQSMQRGGTVASPFDAPLTRAMLFFPRAFASLALPPGIGQFLIAFAIVAALTTALFFAAARLNVSYEDASIVLAQNKLQRSLRGQRRPGTAISFRRFPPLFRLRASHRPEVAVLWKNLIASMRIASPWMIMMVLFTVVSVVAAFTFTLPGIAVTCGTMMVTLACIFPFFGPQVFAQDLRLDLSRIEILKSFPISGERLLIAEMAAPLAVVTSIEMMFLIGMNVIFRYVDVPGNMAALASPQLIVIGLLFTIPICGAQLLIHNAVPVLLPAWAMRSKEEPRGFAVTGQRLVLFFGNLVVLAIALLPAALLFLPAWWLTHRFFAGSSLGLALLITPSVALMTAEVWLGMKFLGAQLDRIDITNEIDTMGV